MVSARCAASVLVQFRASACLGVPSVRRSRRGHTCARASKARAFSRTARGQMHGAACAAIVYASLR
eukprot:3968182-Lingulodinium_polyedra.AAC.1